MGCGAQQVVDEPCAQLPCSLPRGPEPDTLLTRGVGKGERYGSGRKVGVDNALDGAQLHLGGLQWMNSPSGLMQSSTSSRATSCCRNAHNSVQLGGTLAAAVQPPSPCRHSPRPECWRCCLHRQPRRGGHRWWPWPAARGTAPSSCLTPVEIIQQAHLSGPLWAGTSACAGGFLHTGQHQMANRCQHGALPQLPSRTP